MLRQVHVLTCNEFATTRNEARSALRVNGSNALRIERTYPCSECTTTVRRKNRNKVSGEERNFIAVFILINSRIDDNIHRESVEDYTCNTFNIAVFFTAHRATFAVNPADVFFDERVIAQANPRFRGHEHFASFTTMLFEGIRHRANVSIRCCTFRRPRDFRNKTLRIAFTIGIVIIFDFDVDRRAVRCRSRHRASHSIVDQSLNAEFFDRTGNTVSKTHDLDTLQVFESLNVSGTAVSHFMGDLFHKYAVIIFRINRVLHPDSGRFYSRSTELRGFAIDITLFHPCTELHILAVEIEDELFREELCAGRILEVSVLDEGILRNFDQKRVCLRHCVVNTDNSRLHCHSGCLLNYMKLLRSIFLERSKDASIFAFFDTLPLVATTGFSSALPPDKRA